MIPHRINHQPAFLLASSPWRENSLRLEVFSRDYGRVALLARSARARGSELRGILMPFVPLSISWFGKEELKTLHRAEWVGGWQQPKNLLLFSALYANEILLKLTAREDPHPNLYHALAQLMQHFGTGQHHLAPLRHFEWQLLHELGYAPSAQHDRQQQPIETHANYLMRPETAAERMAEAESSLHSVPNSCIISGDVLQALETSSLQPHQLQAALALNRLFIQHYLPEGIVSRQALHQLQQMKQKLSSVISP
ncbi:Recombination protein O [Kingella denitrificans]|uniref:DNA repair protein RecO n=1 Tax=Kingella denitrificans ATCC 33394 TaxID=888741 RepID=F0EZ13_9NEIS|nr:DNA repair protein RecO [Kingella denitrificans]EGC17771.1 DNA repair protein RecO [Kingella denitrificans ATCC 33394]QQB41720.1 DNA repair protein RecO [Kingella denitrificans]STR12420.1 Recombination protein O [Kingella denitrificans]